MKKTTENMLKKRGIDISKHKHKEKAIRQEVSSYFEKSDLEDFGCYEVDTIDDFYGNDTYEVLYHCYTRLETDEELGRRLCDEHDKEDKRRAGIALRKEKLIADAKKLGMEFKK